MITFDPQQRLFVLHGTGFSYALWCPPEISAHDQPVPDPLLHLYWGAPISLADALARTDACLPPRRGFDSPLDGSEEYPPSGGLRFGRAALDVDAAWRYTGHVLDGDHLALEFASGGLAFALHYRVRGSALERRSVLVNAGDEAVGLTRFDSAVWTLPEWPRHRMSRLVGHWVGETQLERTPLPTGVTEIGSRRGISSHHANPWFAVDDGTASEEHGDVYAGALSWSGSWHFAAQRAGHRAQVFGGWIPPTRIAPGEAVQTPSFVGVYSPDGFTGASQTLHAYAMQHVIPSPTATRPVLYNSWEATRFAVDEAGQIGLAKQAAALGVELFVMDDGWFGGRMNGRAGLGDWQPNPRKFPRGLGPLIDEVHRLGMDFGLWVEPEMVNPDSDLYRAHPDWAHHRADRPRYELRGQLVLNLARPDVAEWTHAWLDALLSDHDIQYLKWDMNRPLVDVPAHDAVGHVRSVYAILDRLRADHPHVAIENCAGGGGRADLGMLARTDVTWTSDNTDASDRLRIQHGFGQAYPARVMSCWVTDSPNPINGRQIPLRFRFHVAMAGVLGIGADLSEWSDAERAEAAELIARYKQVRHLVQHGVQYRLGAPGDAVHGVQYVAAGGAEALVLAYRETGRYRDASPALRLRGLRADATYRIDGGAARSGAALMADGVRPGLVGDFASALLHVVRTPSGPDALP